MFPESLKPISINLRQKHFLELPDNGGVCYPLKKICPAYSSSADGVVRTSRPEMFTVGSGDVPDSVPQDPVDGLVYARLLMHVATMREHGKPRLVFLKSGPGVMNRTFSNGKRHHWVDCVLWAEEESDGG